MPGITDMCETTTCKAGEYVVAFFLCLRTHIFTKMLPTAGINWLNDFKAKLLGRVKALTVNYNPSTSPNSDLDMRYRAAVSDSEACLMPELA